MLLTETCSCLGNTNEVVLTFEINFCAVIFKVIEDVHTSVYKKKRSAITLCVMWSVTEICWKPQNHLDS